LETEQQAEFVFKSRAMSEYRVAEEAEEEEPLMGGGPAATRPLWLYASNAHVWHKVAGVSGPSSLPT
jgi:hypothetical protein